MGLTFGSLFAGIGGFDLGLTRTGWHGTAQVEIDPRCREVLARHFPDARRHDDVTTASAATIGAVDLLCGGFPCQDLSVAGRRAGLAGARSGLFHEFMRLAAELAPRWVLIENVPGLLSSNGGGDMGVVLGTLGQLGYGWAYRSLDAQYFGLAQRRERVFIVGCLGDAARAAAVLFESESGGGNPPPRREAGEGTPRGVATGAATGRGYWRDGTGTLSARDEKDAGILVAIPQVSGPLGGPSGEGGFRQDLDNHGAYIPISVHLTQDPISEHDFTPALGATEGSMGVLAYQCQGTNVGEMGTLRSGNGHVTGGVPFVTAFSSKDYGGDATADLSPTLRSMNYDQSHINGGGQVAVAFSKNQRAETRLTDYARQITTGGGKPGQGYPAVLAGMAVRRLTPTECERLQGFPDGWTEGHSDSTRYRMLGNAVAVPCAEWIGRRILEMA